VRETIKAFFRFDELQTNKSLRFFGGMLCIAHIVTAARWAFTNDMYRFLMPSVDSTCWPFFSSCAEYKVLSDTGSLIVVGVYALLSLCLALAFWSNRASGSKLAVGFTLLWALKGSVMACDYHYRHNANYMHFLVSLAFLVGPNRKITCQWMLVLFYFWAGTLKLNHEWLSGADLYAVPYLVPAALIPTSVIYVVVLEIVISWCLLARSQVICRLALFQFVIFHILSWGSVGFFYPLMMLCLLTIFMFADREKVTKRVIIGLAVYGLSFSMLQVPHWVLSKDSAITGEGRFLSLDMFDALVQCIPAASIEANGTKTYVPLIRPGDEPRIRCEPSVVLEYAKNLCHRRGTSQTKIGVSLYSKRSSNPQWYKVIDLENVCSLDISYSSFSHNSWITLEPVSSDTALRDMTSWRKASMERARMQHQNKIAPVPMMRSKVEPEY
jgi:hypothetical protein